MFVVVVVVVVVIAVVGVVGVVGVICVFHYVLYMFTYMYDCWPGYPSTGMLSLEILHI